MSSSVDLWLLEYSAIHNDGWLWCSPPTDGDGVGWLIVDGGAAVVVVVLELVVVAATEPSWPIVVAGAGGGSAAAGPGAVAVARD